MFYFNFFIIYNNIIMYYKLYYNNLLDGNIPSNVLDCSVGFNNMYMTYNSTKYSYVKINKEEVNLTKNMNNDIKVYFNKSLNLNRNMILESLKYSLDQIISSTNKTGVDLYFYMVSTIISTIFTNVNRNIMDIILLIFCIDKQDTEKLIFNIINTFNVNKELIFDPFSNKSYYSLLKYFTTSKVNINLLADNILYNLEYILYHLLNNTSNNSICNIYVISIIIAEKITNAMKYNTIEGFANDNCKSKPNQGYGNGTTIDNNKKVNNTKDINTNIDQSKVIKGVNKLITNVVNEVMNNNKAELTQALAVSNKINISNLKSKGDITIENISQRSDANQQLKMQSIQTTINKVANELNNKITEQIKTMVDNNITNIDKSLTDETDMTEVSKLTNNVGNLLYAGFKAGTVIDNSQEINDLLKKTFNLNQSFNYNKDNNTNSDIKNVINQEQLSMCNNNTNLSNDFNVAGYDSGGNIILRNINQNNVINTFMDCQMTQTAMNELSTKIANELDNIIDQINKNVNTDITDVERKKAQKTVLNTAIVAKKILENEGDYECDKSKGSSSNNKGLGTGAIVGIVIGSLVGVILTCVLSYFAYRQLKNKN